MFASISTIAAPKSISNRRSHILRYPLQGRPCRPQHHRKSSEPIATPSSVWTAPSPLSACQCREKFRASLTMKATSPTVTKSSLSRLGLMVRGKWKKTRSTSGHAKVS
jgi:hypothetical protein